MNFNAELLSLWGAVLERLDRIYTPDNLPQKLFFFT